MNAKIIQQAQEQTITYMMSIKKRDRNQRERIIHTRFIIVRQPMPTPNLQGKKQLLFFLRHTFFFH